MKTKEYLMIVLVTFIFFSSCKNIPKHEAVDILYLHHSTGGMIWKGESSNSRKGDLEAMFTSYNKAEGLNYKIVQMEFPKANPYGWNNYPFDYYNIWVKNGGNNPYMEEPTLEILTGKYDVIMFKHCFPVSNIQEDSDSADIDSDIKTIGNYKLQYEALRNTLNDYPDTKFIVWTGAVQVHTAIREDEALRAREFFSWVVNEWDIPGDNIYVWDFYKLETEGGLYFKEEYAASATDSHPNRSFAGKAAKLLFNRIVDVIETDGNGTTLTGEMRE